MSAVESSLKGYTVVVTGSSSGIGQAIAVACARDGADVVVHARTNQSGADETAAMVREVGREATVLLADLGDVTKQDKLVDEAWKWRPIDVWVNNAGADVLTGDAAEWSFEKKLDALWRVDVTATLRLSRAIGRLMRTRGTGSIINIGWDQATTGMERDSGELFAAAKGAVMAATLSLAKSLAPQVRVNCIAPGWIRTAWGATAPQEWQQRARGESLLARWGQAHDIANVARFLASPEAAFVNGQIIHVNGGRRS